MPSCGAQDTIEAFKHNVKATVWRDHTNQGKVRHVTWRDEEVLIPLDDPGDHSNSCQRVSTPTHVTTEALQQEVKAILNKGVQGSVDQAGALGHQ